MKNNKIIKSLIILIIIIFLTFLFYKIFIRIEFNTYVKNTSSNLSKINYDSNIYLNMIGENQKLNVTYSMKKSNGVVYISYKQINNDEVSTNVEKYYIKENGKIYTYIYNNSWIKNNETKINKIFNVNYNKLKYNIYNVKYLGETTIYDNKCKFYSLTMPASAAYNLIYKKNVLSKKDINKKIKVMIYVDKKTGIISVIRYKINNINNSNDNKYKFKYNLEIVNKNINNNDVLKVPFEK